MKNLTDLPEYIALTAHHAQIANQRMRDWFVQDAGRFKRFSIQQGDILLDYSRNRINETTQALLCDLANSLQLPAKIEALFNGHAVNNTEKRPALHMALRDPSPSAIMVNGKDIKPVIRETRDKMRAITAKIHRQEWLGVTGKPIKHVINIGIGGSHVGPMMCVQALKEAAVADLQFHFISTVDKTPLHDLFKTIDPETSLFIISSKSFTTLETMTNTETVLAWMQEQLGADVIKHHFIGTTVAIDKARAMGLPEAHILPFWEWVGGRYSIWSAIGLPLMLMIGSEQFDAFLAGAYQMDVHFRQTAFSQNLPVMLALLGVWYTNFFGTKAHAIIPYAQRLNLLIPYLQQADMESNGKGISLNGSPLSYTTSPVIFGAEGCDGQHTFHQLLHQGQHLIPVDFILLSQTANQHDKHHAILLASALSQAHALMHGKTYEEALHELLQANYPGQAASQLAQHKMIPGNRPSNVLCLTSLTPHTLGALIALYEHKIFVQGVIWDINSFDQWGVELGKQILPTILRHIQGKESTPNIDSATMGLIAHLKFQ